MPIYKKLNEKELQAKAALFFKDNTNDKVVYVSEDGFCFIEANKLQGQNYVSGKKLELIEVKAEEPVEKTEEEPVEKTKTKVSTKKK